LDIDKLEACIEEIKLANIMESSLIYIDGRNTSLKNKIHEIRETFLSCWEQDQLPIVMNCAKKLRNGIPLPVLSICGEGTREIRYTKYLAYFLDPVKPHGLGSEFLKQVLRIDINRLGISEDVLDKVKVENEVLIGTIPGKSGSVSCFCDIVLEGTGIVIFIEQKIHSSESGHLNSRFSQLHRYSRAIDKNPRYEDLKQLKVYLTPQNKQPKNVQDWIPITHRQLVETGLELLEDSALSNIARENFARFLMDIAVGPYSGTESDLIELRNISDDLVNREFRLDKYIRFSNLSAENNILLKIIGECNAGENDRSR